jgi:hypothetical protein
MSRARAVPLLLLAGLYLASPVVPQGQKTPADPYRQVGLLPTSVDGQSLHAFAFDPTTKTLYAASSYAVFRAQMTAERPRLQKVATRRLSRIEIAPDLGKLFYLGVDEVGSIDLRAPAPRPVRIAALPHAIDLAYEPTRQELYVSNSRGPLVVFDAKSGERGAVLELPGWSAYDLEATRGRVFLMLDSVFGLFAVDAATHAVAPWPVHGRISTPARLDADPEGRYLFMAYHREFVAIDIPSATVLSRVVTPATPSIAFDPESNLLIATWNDDPPPMQIVTYAVSATGLAETARIENPAIGRVGVEPMYGGFVQRGFRDLIVWRRRPAAGP